MPVKCKCHLYILPIVVIFFIAFCYYVYVIGICVFVIHNVLESVLYIIFFNVLFVLLLWSYLSTVLTRTAKVPPIYKLTDEEIELLNQSDNPNKNLVLDRISRDKNLVIQTRYPAGNIRYCLKCKQIKPDRARHCSSCGVCVLKMDHHCPWVNNCIGFSNYKSFLLFLLYMILFNMYIICTSMKYIHVIMWNQEMQLIVVGIFIALFYGLFGGTILFYHCLLLSKNETSIDKLQQPIFVVENATFDMGYCGNLVEVFGKNWLLWPFPVFTSLGSGCSFPIRILNASHSNV